jgi:hypothetical protein
MGALMVQSEETEGFGYPRGTLGQPCFTHHLPCLWPELDDDFPLAESMTHSS